MSLNLFAGIAVGDFSVPTVTYADPDGSEIAFGEVPQ